MLLVTISFDASQVDLGTSLTSGHTLVLANEEECKDAVMLADLMMRTGVDAFDATPSRLAAMLELPAFREAVSRCRLLNIGGEGFPQSLLKRLRVDAGFKGLIVNEYGPTETTVGSNHAILKLGEPVTAGRPFYNYREYIVDPWGARYLSESPANYISPERVSEKDTTTCRRKTLKVSCSSTVNRLTAPATLPGGHRKAMSKSPGESTIR